MPNPLARNVKVSSREWYGTAEKDLLHKNYRNATKVELVQQQR